MSWTKWLPWRYILRHMARRHGFLDPIALLARLQRFSQPSEVGEPIELLRAGVVFHARGLINSRVIQHNLDWVWPYWVERQFNPHDSSFIPRAFSLTHVNLTQRNWTAIGCPEGGELPIVDPRGLLTPHHDGWSLDSWLITADGRCLLPSRAATVSQQLELETGLSITTTTASGGLQLDSEATVSCSSGQPVCNLTLQAETDAEGWIVLALRPQNPEGVSFIHQLSLFSQRDGWSVEGAPAVHFSTPAARHHVSDYRNGDVRSHLLEAEDQTQGICDIGLITAAAMFPIKAGEDREITARIPLSATSETGATDSWDRIRQPLCRLQCPDPHYRFLYDAAISSLILHSSDDIYPGPYTYKRFWFRDAAFIINALLCSGLTDRAERAIERFPERQTALGYFRSQEGEWDSNGEVLWILQRFHDFSDRPLSPDLRGPVRRGARWILRKRTATSSSLPHAGLLPAGFSAEHLGPNDYYYWDDFWGIAGLHAAADLCADFDSNSSAAFARGTKDFSTALERSLTGCEKRLERPAMPASPYRRLDAGAIGSLAGGYPLQIQAADDPRLLDTVEFLLQHCFIDNAFFQDMIHSGLNAYLTLHVAQVLLRNGDPRYIELMDAVANLASATGQWPEAIHPQTGGGCMGDGHHVWASAEWVMMIRHCFVREENDRLVLCAGIPQRWLEHDQTISFGPAPTAFGPISIEVTPNSARSGETEVAWRADWHTATAPPIEICLPNHAPVRIPPSQTAQSDSRPRQTATLSRISP